MLGFLSSHEVEHEMFLRVSNLVRHERTQIGPYGSAPHTIRKCSRSSEPQKLRCLHSRRPHLCHRLLPHESDAGGRERCPRRSCALWISPDVRVVRRWPVTSGEKAAWRSWRLTRPMTPLAWWPALRNSVHYPYGCLRLHALRSVRCSNVPVVWPGSSTSLMFLTKTDL